MLARVPQDPGARRGAVFFLSAAIGSVFIAWRVHRWWKREYGEMKDEGLFDDLEEPPLFDSGVVFPARTTANRVSSPGDEMEYITSPLSIAERENALELARTLLRQLNGSEDGQDELAAESSGSEDETNVSLNYHIATEMEKDTRDRLVQMVVQSEMLKTEAQGKVIKASDCLEVLEMLVEYFDISNEREKLRERRTALYGEEGPTDGFPWAANGGHKDFMGQQMTKINEAYAGFLSRETEMDRRLHGFGGKEAEERFEMDWDADDEDGNNNEAELMAYLDREDAAGYGSRMELRMGDMQQPDFRLVGLGGGVYGDDDDDDDDEFDEEDDSDDVLEKAGFERMLLSRLHKLAASLGQRGATSLTTGAAESPQSNGRKGCDANPKMDVEAGQDEWETESDFDNDEDAV